MQGVTMKNKDLIHHFIKLKDGLLEGGVLWKDFELEELANSSRIPFNAAYFSVSENSQTKIDQHEERELWVVINGIGELTYNRSKYTIKSGDIIFFESQQQHQLRNIGCESLGIYSIYWKS